MYLNKLYFTKKPHINTEIYILKIKIGDILKKKKFEIYFR